MAKLKAETTLTITAIDMHACGVDVDSIHLGDTVHLHSIPHGLDKDEVCTAVELDIENPEKSDYTFGFPQESLTDGNANTVKRFSSMLNDQHRWLTETDEALNITVENVNLIGHRTTVIEGDFNAAKAEIALKAAQSSVDILEARVSGAEVRIDGAEAEIELKAAQAVVDKMGERVSAAELRIDGAESAIALKANKVDIEGFLTVDDGAVVAGMLNSEDLNCNTLNANSSVATEYVNAYDVPTAGLTVGGSEASWQSKEVVTGVNYQLETATTPPFFNANGTQVSAGITYVKNVIITPVKETINFLGKE
jgi:flagellar hook-basal body complex protein FliE